ncbi:hypothetical protein LSH36_2372g00001 [Paralvinella palmiformis]|uniref:Uncharacterized protein n=1 Tax=Paralvinella palmiformis TaxID=53620 RepID=A0AAD9MNL5_9ANNE|nr:hypothetical protein LSH36_2372g00001 [Paralvinella palmiformis]
MMESSDRRESSNQDHQGAAPDVVEDPEKQHSTQQLFSTDEKKDDNKKSESNKSCDKKRDEVNPHLETVDDMASDASTRDLLWKTGILAGGTDAHTKSRGRDIFGCYSDGDENCGVHLLPAGCTGLPPGDGCHNQGEKYSRATSVVTHQGAAQYSPAESSRRQNSQRLSYKRDDNELYNEKCNDKKGDNNNSGHVPRVKDTEEVPSDSSNEGIFVILFLGEHVLLLLFSL